jgi:dipeptide transport system substrate-binding protein
LLSKFLVFDPLFNSFNGCVRLIFMRFIRFAFAWLVMILLMKAFPATAAPSLSICTEASPDGFDVVQYNSLVTTNASADVLFDGLVKLDETTHQILPALAQRWDISPDGRSYTFYLRANVAFHTTSYFKPKRSFNADDVVFTFERMINPHHPWHQVAGPSGFPHAQSMQLATMIQRVEKVGDLAVRFILKEPDSTFLPILTMGFASIYSEEYADQLYRSKNTAQLDAQPIGTGPFKLRRYQKDAIIRYDAHPGYWGNKPPLAKLIYVITPDAAVRAQKLKAGECKIALSPRPVDVLAFKNHPSIAIAKRPAFMTAFVALNTQHKPFNLLKVRQAIQMAFDRTAYLKTVFEGAAMPAYHPYPSSNLMALSKEDLLTAYPYDWRRAKALLAEAGLPNGFQTTLWTRPTGSILNPSPKTGAELLQADLAKIGIGARIKIIEWGELIRSAKLGQHDLLFMGWSGDNGDPDNFMTPQFTCAAIKAGTNFSRFCHHQLDSLISEAKKTADPKRRAQLYLAAQAIIHNQALWLPIAHPTATVLMQKSVKGYEVSPFGRQDFRKVIVKD